MSSPVSLRRLVSCRHRSLSAIARLQPAAVAAVSGSANLTSRRDISIGILRENYDKWERRVAITPTHVQQLLAEFRGTLPNQLSNIYVQPSQRIFPDSQYKAAGATISECLDEADILLGVKRVASEDDLIPDKTYFFFSHVIKGQPENMALLQAILDKNIQLIDYEAIAEDVKDPSNGKMKKRRLVAFGKYAGIAGMIDTFQCLGRRLLASGYSTPFLNCPQAYIHYDLDEAKRAVSEMGKRIEKDGLPMNLEPLIFAFTGNGNVTNGALEIFKLLPHKMITLEEAKELKNQPGPHRCVYGLMVHQKDIVKKTNGGGEFDVKHYRENPVEYESTFASNVAPLCNVLINGIYWDERYPRLLTKAEASELYENGSNNRHVVRLYVLGDISCDIEGSIEFLEKTTSIDKPFFSWNPTTNEVSDDISDEGIAVMGVDILPTELSVESSKHFGNALMPLLKRLISAGFTKEDDVYEKLPSELANACITQNGSLTPNFKYIEALMNRARTSAAAVHHSVGEPHLLLRITGHLFDSGLINQILDVIEGQDCHFEIEDCIVKRTISGVATKSTLMLRVFSEDNDKLDHVLRKVTLLLDLIDSAEASMQHFDNRVKPNWDQDKVTVLGDKERNILLLGAGKVAASFAEYLGRSKSNTITVASQFEADSMRTAHYATRGKAVTCDLSQPGDKLKYLIEEADIVVSLLPAPMHPMVAEECISLKTDLVTASYESDEMKKLGDRCKEAGIRILNEVGLDPGMDHMSAMKIIDDVKRRGGEITSFSSVCGGLPAPEVANNPLLYKFSWSPLGVMKASQNDAVYRRDGKIVKVEGANLLASAEPFNAWQSLHMECLPNRYSLVDIPVFKTMGLLEDKPVGSISWYDALDKLCKANGSLDLRSYVLSCAQNDRDLALRAFNCLSWLGLKEHTPVSEPSSMVQSFCDILQQHLNFEEGERDMVLMHHDIKAMFANGNVETHTCSLQLFGDTNMTAMCKTVGYTAAIGTKLILEGGIESKGLLLPTSKEIYVPALKLLENEGIIFNEQVYVENIHGEAM
eukprot:CCRYP_019250-RD/>CCRYP_019250-RD protein AED:0.09 eAED:0.09 QI:158/0.81/0.91/1/0.90/0.91/12/496/1041